MDHVGNTNRPLECNATENAFWTGHWGSGSSFQTQKTSEKIEKTETKSTKDKTHSDEYNCQQVQWGWRKSTIDEEWRWYRGTGAYATRKRFIKSVIETILYKKCYTVVKTSKPKNTIKTRLKAEFELIMDRPFMFALVAYGQILQIGRFSSPTISDNLDISNQPHNYWFIKKSKRLWKPQFTSATTRYRIFTTRNTYTLIHTPVNYSQNKKKSS